MSTAIATTAPVPAATTAPAVAAPAPDQAPSTTEAPSSSVDDATYMMNTYSTLLEGDLYDDELNGESLLMLIS